MVEVITDRASGATTRESDPTGAWSAWLRLRPPAVTAASIALRVPIGEPQVRDLAIAAGIDLFAAERPSGGFQSVADAIRRRDRELPLGDTDPDTLYAFADGRVRVVPEIHDGVLAVGESRIAIADLAALPATADEYDRGTAVVIRMGIADLRWVAALDHGTLCRARVLPATRAAAALRPMVPLSSAPALGGPRAVLRLLTRAFGDVTLALIAGPYGRIHQAFTPGAVQPGQRLACVEGLSGIAIALFERGRLVVDEDLERAGPDRETLVRRGTPIARRIS